MVEAQPLDERDALQHGGEPVAVVRRRAEQEPLGLRGDEREALAGRHQRVGRRRRRLVPRGLPVQVVEVGAGEVAADRACAGAGRAAGQPVAVGRLVRVHGPRRVADQLPRHPLEHQRRPEHGVPAPRAQHPGAELGRAAVCGPGDDRGLGGQPGLLRGRRAHRADHGPGSDQLWKHVCRHAQRVEHVPRPGLVDQVGTGLERIAQVRGHRAAREPTGDEVALVGQPGPRDQVGVLAEQPQQLRQRPGGLHPLVAELAPDRAADLVDPADLGGGTRVVVHEAGGQGSAVGVDEQDGSRRRVDRDPAHHCRGNLAQRVPARRGDGVPPVVGVLLVARAVAAARQLPGSAARDGAVCGHGERADALRSEVQADPPTRRQSTSRPPRRACERGNTPDEPAAGRDDHQPGRRCTARPDHRTHGAVR